MIFQDNTTSMPFQVANTATSMTMASSQRLVIVSAVGQTITLPNSNDETIIPTIFYMIVFPANLTSAGTVAVQSGDSLNGTVNGTYAAPISVTYNKTVIATSSGTGWYIN